MATYGPKWLSETIIEVKGDLQLMKHGNMVSVASVVSGGNVKMIATGLILGMNGGDMMLNFSLSWKMFGWYVDIFITP